MQYSQDFEIITKESLKRATNGQLSILLMKNPTVVSPAPAGSLQMSTFCDRYLQRTSTPETESAIKEFVESYRPLRQRIVLEEPTKGKTAALPPAVYTKQQDSTKVDLLAD